MNLRPRLGIAAALVLFTGAWLRAQSNYATPYTFTTLAGQAGLDTLLGGAGRDQFVSDVIGVSASNAQVLGPEVRDYQPGTDYRVSQVPAAESIAQLIIATLSPTVETRPLAH